MNKQQRGMTLIELMISMVLSLGLIAGISSLFLQMQKSNKVQRGVSAMADDSSYVQEVLQKEIRSTGRLRSRSDTNGINARVFLDPPGDVLGSGVNLLQGEYIKGDDTSPENDSFVMRYQLLDANDLRTGTVSNGSSPCTQNVLMLPTDAVPVAGTPAMPSTAGDPAAEVHVVNVYFYLNGNTLTCLAQRQKVDVVNNRSQCLKNCNAPGSLTDFTRDSTVAPVEIISNVEKLLVGYGVDANFDGAADYYVGANDVDTGAPGSTGTDNLWNSVVSVRMTVVVRSEEKYIRDSVVAYSLPNGLPPCPNSNDCTPDDDQHQLYKVFTTTIALRNQLM